MEAREGLRVRAVSGEARRARAGLGSRARAARLAARARMVAAGAPGVAWPAYDELTGTDLAIILVARGYQATAGRPPTVAELVGLTGTCNTSVDLAMRRGQAAGVVERRPFGSRAVDWWAGWRWEQA